MEQYIYKIAGLNLSIKGESTAALVDSLQGFDLFRVYNGHDSDIELIVDCKGLRTYTKESEEVLTDFEVNDTNHRFTLCDDTFFFELRSGLNQSVLLSHKRGEDVVRMESCECEFMLRYMLWVAYALVAIPKGVVPIHSSAVVFNDKAVMCLGKSGAGKSTQTAGWLTHVKDSSLLNDDSPLLRVDGGKLIACGSPWSGKPLVIRMKSMR